MKIAILSKSESIYSTRRLIEALQSRHHQVQRVDVHRCQLDITSKGPILCQDGKKLEGFAAVVPRIAASQTEQGLAVLRHFEGQGAYTPCRSQAIRQSRDKLHSLQILASAGLPVPRTAYSGERGAIAELVNSVGGPPVILKLLKGTQGKGVMMGRSHKQAESIIESFHALKAPFLVQEFLPGTGGSDVRCFVLGGKVLTAMKRQGAEGDFRSNLHAGGHAEKVHLNESEKELAVNAARVLGLNLAGVDLVRSNAGTFVLEVNSSPGLKGVEETNGVDVALAITQHIEERVSRILSGPAFWSEHPMSLSQAEVPSRHPHGNSHSNGPS